MQSKLTHLYETFAKFYDHVSNPVCFIAGSTTGVVIQNAQAQSTNWPDFLLKTCIAGLAPLVIKIGFEGIIKLINNARK